MSIVVTGATGHLGRLVVEALLRRGVPAADIVATGRDTTAIKDLADRGVQVRRADFADAASLAEAFAGADKVLLVSASVPVGDRVANHKRALDAAAAAGVSLLAFTSMLHTETSTVPLAGTFRATEAHLRESGVPTVLLRNGWYLENYSERLGQILDSGALLGAAGQGRDSAATRADYAEAAAVVLTTDGHAGKAYELGGDEAFTMAELAAAISAAAGRTVPYTDLPAAEYAAALKGAGLPGEIADTVASADLGVSIGERFTGSGDLSRLIGRPTTPLSDVLAAALR